MKKEFFENLKKNLKSPPKGYGIVPFYWWCGDVLTKERIAEQIRLVSEYRFSGVQVNYCHSFSGGNSWGLTYAGDPPLFSDDWWELFSFLIDECKKYGMTVSLSDYTLSGVGQGYFMDEIISKNPDIHGKILIKTDAPDTNDEVLYKYPTEEMYIVSRTVYTSVDPMNERLGSLVCEHFFDRFEEKTGAKGGSELDFFFSDELSFGVSGNLWNGKFRENFINDHGYDPIPLLPLLFDGADEKAYKFRYDYNNTVVSAEIRGYFEPVYAWHTSRGMTYGCDHGSRGYDAAEFGDYFKTVKYNAGPGCDQPRLGSDIFKNKVASSISHIYKRQRTWLEGFYSSGWGTSTEDLTDAIARNFVMGHNLLSLHGMYYSTYGGYWEWAPPCNCLRMPYMKHAKTLFHAVERMSFLLSQGHHVCKLGIYYPSEDVICRCENSLAMECAVYLTELIYKNGIDLDLLNGEVISDAKALDGKYKIADEEYEILIIPPCEFLPESVKNKLSELSAHGISLIYCSGAEFSENRAEFGEGILKTLHEKNAQTVHADGEYYTLKRKLGTLDIYMTYGIKKGTVCRFESVGKPYFFDAFSGEISEIPSVFSDGRSTSVKMKTDKNEISIIIFDTEDQASFEISGDEGDASVKIELPEEWDFRLIPTMDNKHGDFELPATNEKIGARVFGLHYSEEDIDTASLLKCPKITASYGARLKAKENFSCENEFLSAIDRAVRGDLTGFSDYEYSERFGVLGEPGIQGYHGLKGLITDDFLTVGRKRTTDIGTVYVPYENGFGKVFAGYFDADTDGEYFIIQGEMKADLIYIDGENVTDKASAALTLGTHRIVFAYRSAGRSHTLIFRKNTVKDEKYPLSMSFYKDPDVCSYYIAKSRGYYAFMSAPGTYGLRMKTDSEVEVFADGKKAITERDGEYVYAKFAPSFYSVPIRIEKAENRDLGGSLFGDAIRLYTDTGKMKLQSWDSIEGLSAYSGGAEYLCTVTLDEIDENIKYELDFDRIVSTAEVFINGISAGVKVSPPWSFDVTKLIKLGENSVRVEVYNTLANSYEVIPTGFRGKTESGIIANKAVNEKI